MSVTKGVQIVKEVSNVTKIWNILYDYYWSTICNFVMALWFANCRKDGKVGKIATSKYFHCSEIQKFFSGKKHEVAVLCPLCTEFIATEEVLRTFSAHLESLIISFKCHAQPLWSWPENRKIPQRWNQVEMIVHICAKEDPLSKKYFQGVFKSYGDFGGQNRALK